MLPPPKRKLPTAIPSGSSLGVNKSMAAQPKAAASNTGADSRDGEEEEEEEGDVAAAASGSGLLLPPSMARKAKKKDEPSLDLFGLGMLTGLLKSGFSR
jgi:proline-rich protein PRCC